MRLNGSLKDECFCSSSSAVAGSVYPAGRGTNDDDSAVSVVGVLSYLQLALPAVDVVCGLVQLLQLALFTGNMAYMGQHRERGRGVWLTQTSCSSQCVCVCVCLCVCVF